MSRIAIELPVVDAEDKIEVELTVNGQKRKLMYRIEIFAWKEQAQVDEPRIECLKRVLREYDKGWQVVEIREPSDREFSVLFRQKER